AVGAATWRAVQRETALRDRIRGNRWAGRPVLSATVLVAAHLIPVAAAVASSAVLSRRLSEPDGWFETVTRWGVLLVVSTLVLLAVDRVARRALPLAALLKLSMVFPDRAPRRLAVARRAGSVKNLQHRLEEAKALGMEDEPTRAAEVILSLVGALHGHDRHTRGHSERVRWFADLIADELKLPDADRDRLRWAALLHDIGKLHVRKRILNKPSKLSAAEWKHIHRHPEEGARIASPLSEWLGEWALTISQHHEKFDGTGYPVGLKGNEISLGARIVAVADAYEVMTAARAYKKAMSAADARRELTKCAGAHFDPAIVRAFLSVSVGRLRWIAGPTAWIAQLPFIGWVPRLTDGAVALTGQAASVVGTAGAAVALTGTAAPVAEGPVVPENPPVLLEIPTPQPGSEVLGLTVTRTPTGTRVAPAGTSTVDAAGTGSQPVATTSTLPNGKEAPQPAATEQQPSTSATSPAAGTPAAEKAPAEKEPPGKAEPAEPGGGRGQQKNG
ncbi:MAG TPA: HD domain-containing phosphohydrolase, partial [Acidimicrobiales bacterium]